MKSYIALLSVVSIASPVTAAAAVYKCTINDTVVYQGTRCESGHEEAQLVPAREIEPIAVPALNPKPPLETHASIRARQEPMRSDDLVVGMSDTKVLNARRWGRPQKITRHRADDGWHEEWTYSSHASEKTLLRFLNGKLIAVNSESAPQQVVQVAEQ